MGNINFFSVFIFLGVFQGIFLVIFLFFDKRGENSLTKKMFAGFLMVLTLLVLRSFLLYSGIKTPNHMIFFSSLDYLMGPLYYLFLLSWIKGQLPRLYFFHFVPFVICLLNIILVPQRDPFFIIHYHVMLTLTHISIYVILIFIRNYIYFKKSRLIIQNKATMGNRSFLLLQKFFGIFAMLCFISRLILSENIGDIAIISYMTALFYILTIIMLKKPNLLQSEIKTKKYEKSPLSTALKDSILKKIKIALEDKPYLKSSFSLGDLAKIVGSSTHYVSQVINECMNLTFSQLIAKYRIEEAQRLLLVSDKNEQTILIISESVGYISKSAFNTAFKKITGLSPSQFKIKKSV